MLIKGILRRRGEDMESGELVFVAHQIPMVRSKSETAEGKTLFTSRDTTRKPHRSAHRKSAQNA